MVAWFLLTSLALAPVASSADGAFAGKLQLDRVAGLTGVASTQQKGIVIELPEGREALLLQTTYHGPAEDFAWIIPVPGKPGNEDVFEASPEFMEAAFSTTRPRVVTMIGGREATHGLGSPGGHRPYGGGLGSEAVVVHERMTVGIYDVTVLSATRKNALADWLTEHGYQVPEDSDDVLNGYVLKRWYFVALKIQPKAVAQRRVLSDVEPIGVRFNADELVYPLAISRISSREKTSLLLVALTNAAVECDQLPEVELPLARPLPQGTCYATVRRKLVEAGPPGLICEYSGPYWFSSDELRYEKEAESRLPRVLGTHEVWMWATRWWTILDREAMVDLTFSPSDRAALHSLVINREAELDPTFRDRVRYARGLGLGETLRQLDDMLLRFSRTYGCLPASLQDMVGRDLPEVGVDSSGNPVPLPGTVQWHRPLGPTPVVRELPIDPLTGRNDTWLYEPTGDPMIDSGGYSTTLHLEAKRAGQPVEHGETP